MAENEVTQYTKEMMDKLRRIPEPTVRSVVKNANSIHKDEMSPLDKLAVKITDKVGSMTFFFLILGWTICWCSYNIIATEIPGLHLNAFDPFPAFVAYLLMSNVIQILLMPLIMVGQNVQGRHSEIRAELDFEINQKAEKEVAVMLQNIQHNTDLLVQLMKHLDCKISEAEVRALSSEKKLAAEVMAIKANATDA